MLGKCCSSPIISALEGREKASPEQPSIIGMSMFSWGTSFQWKMWRDVKEDLTLTSGLHMNLHICVHAWAHMCLHTFKEKQTLYTYACKIDECFQDFFK